VISYHAGHDELAAAVQKHCHFIHLQPYVLQFMATEERRARYWARSFAGWHEFAAVQPNRAHYALAQMQRMGWAQDIITQNVDRLHHKGASRDIIELHGTTHRCASWVALLSCCHQCM